MYIILQMISLIQHAGNINLKGIDILAMKATQPKLVCFSPQECILQKKRMCSSGEQILFLEEQNISFLSEQIPFQKGLSRMEG